MHFAAREVFVSGTEAAHVWPRGRAVDPAQRSPATVCPEGGRCWPAVPRPTGPGQPCQEVTPQECFWCDIGCMGGWGGGAGQAGKFLTWTKQCTGCHGTAFLHAPSSVGTRSHPCRTLASACGPLAKQSYRHAGRGTPGRRRRCAVVQ
ncbi:hypothetical protein E2C01_020599 [Portunus trituberculatus]|uniref:Uncharacterized protein n=1 Tax=Portunus trituberculatus TaxID=210409 RepID=A0A5B7E0K4_PORTR|nr:hypothetical protein [Portunus trituberculatus]